ncbi:MAG: glucose-1-phosphate cytidylyltransferase [Actinomycetia bacterium]|nr:glucose-1-phosphate cytidylyltransferase [Actinomycetes bacterium]MCP3993357.1 glucose-1-phosphate cytidylyltransferase [Actinomycetes bacterium]MCP4085962.1 glucose-1-phosphate cytidylyltransferase [Actinomycetes bacterium]
MKAVILAGGLGTRLSEETTLKPKPMVEIGGKPILWHIMKIYAAHGVNDFVICCGYKGYVIKEYFANYFLHTSDVTFDLRDNDLEVHQTTSEPWRITLVDTGESSGTGGRLKLVADHVADDTFCFTYGDGVSNTDIAATIATHRAQGRLATLTAVQPPSRYGVLDLQDNQVKAFVEKPADGGWINGGFFVLEPGAIDYIPDAEVHWEQGPMQALAAAGQLTAYCHDGFWQPMDTLRERSLLEQLWADGNAPWKVW